MSTANVEAYSQSSRGKRSLIGDFEAELDDVFSATGKTVVVPSNPRQKLVPLVVQYSNYMLGTYVDITASDFIIRSQYEGLLNGMGSLPEIELIFPLDKDRRNTGSHVGRWGGARVFPHNPNAHSDQSVIWVNQDRRFWLSNKNICSLDDAGIVRLLLTDTAQNDSEPSDEASGHCSDDGCNFGGMANQMDTNQLDR